MLPHLAPSFEQLERTSGPTNNEYPPLTPSISRPLTHGPISRPPQQKTRFYDRRFGPEIMKCVVFVVGLACVVCFGSITMTAGNEILANTHPSHSTNTEAAAIVGCIGGVFAYGLPLLCYFSFDAIHTFLKERGFLVVLIILTTANFAFAAVLGPIGCIIYIKIAKKSSGLGGLNVGNAALMGIIGGSFWMILILVLAGYLSRTLNNEAAEPRVTDKYREQRRDLDIAFGHR